MSPCAERLEQPVELAEVAEERLRLKLRRSHPDVNLTRIGTLGTTR